MSKKSMPSPPKGCERVIFRLTGTGLGLLHHSTRIMSFIEETIGGTPHDKFIPRPELERELGCYRMDSGQLCLPSACILGMLTQVLKGLQWPVASLEYHAMTPEGKSVKIQASKPRMTKALSVVYGATSMQEEQMPMFDPDTLKPITDYESGLHAAKVGGWPKVTVMRARAFFPRWSADVVMDVNTSVLGNNIDALLATFQDGGVRCGVCDQRPSSPQTPGAYGTFSVERITQAQHDKTVKVRDKAMTPAVSRKINAAVDQIIEDGRAHVRGLAASKSEKDASRRQAAKKKTSVKKTTKKKTAKKKTAKKKTTKKSSAELATV